MRRIRKNSSNKTLRLALLIVILVALYFVLEEGKKQPPGKPDESGFLTAVEIYDGDTFLDSKDQEVRLLGIDTPENGQPFYKEAGKTLGNLTLGRELRYEFDHRKRDRYGRLLAYVYSGDDFINQELVMAGMARVYIFPKDMKNSVCRRALIESQVLARKNENGIWSLPEPYSEEYYIGNSATFRFHRPGCHSVEVMNEADKIVKKTRDEFLDQGYSPCRNCNP